MTINENCTFYIKIVWICNNHDSQFLLYQIPCIVELVFIIWNNRICKNRFFLKNRNILVMLNVFMLGEEDLCLEYNCDVHNTAYIFVWGLAGYNICCSVSIYIASFYHTIICHTGKTHVCNLHLVSRTGLLKAWLRIDQRLPSTNGQVKIWTKLWETQSICLLYLS